MARNYIIISSNWITIRIDNCDIAHHHGCVQRTVVFEKTSFVEGMTERSIVYIFPTDQNIWK